MMTTIDNFEKSYNPIIGHFQAPKLTKKPELDPTGDFFWETRTNNGVKQKSTIPVSLEKALPKINPYSRTKTTLASEDPDKEYKLKQALDWRNEIQMQIDEKRKRELFEKQRDELEESMLLARHNRIIFQDQQSGLASLKLIKETVFDKEVATVKNDEEIIGKVYNSKAQKQYNASLPSKIPRFNLSKINKTRVPEVEKIELNRKKVIEPIEKRNQINLQNQSGTKEKERQKQSIEKPKEPKIEPAKEKPKEQKKKKQEERKEIISRKEATTPANPKRELVEKKRQQQQQEQQRKERLEPKEKVIEHIIPTKDQFQETPIHPQKPVDKEQEPIQFTPLPPKSKPRNQGDLHKRKLKNTDNEMERLKSVNLGHLEEIQKILNYKQKEHS
jgi:hypothetical protein